MRLSLLVSCLALVAPVFSEFQEQDYPESLRGTGPLDISKFPYLGDGTEEGVSRGPCPFLNTAANHGIIPYNGKNLPFEFLTRVSQKAGFSPLIGKFQHKAMALVAKTLNDIGKQLGHSKLHPLDRLDLQDLALHQYHAKLPEHDCSISRYDTYNKNFLPDQRPNPELVEAYVALAVPGKDGKKYLDYKLTSTHIRNRWDQEKKAHDKVYFGLHGQITMAGEVVFLLEVMGRDGKISVDDAREFFIHQRFPKAWTPGSLSFVHFAEKVMKVMSEFNEPAVLLKWRPFDKFKKFYSKHFLGELDVSDMTDG